MNEVSINQAQSTLVTRAGASSKGAVIAQPNEGGKSLPNTNESGNVSTSKAVEDTPAESEKQLDNAVASVNSYVQSIQRDLQFSVDEESEKTVIKVLDGGSGELIRQIPEDIFLELARNLKQDGELQLVNTLG